MAVAWTSCYSCVVFVSVQNEYKIHIFLFRRILGWYSFNIYKTALIVLDEVDPAV